MVSLQPCKVVLEIGRRFLPKLEAVSRRRICERRSQADNVKGQVVAAGIACPPFLAADERKAAFAPEFAETKLVDDILAEIGTKGGGKQITVGVLRSGIFKAGEHRIQPVQ